MDVKIGRMRERSQKLQQELTRQLLGTGGDSISSEVGRIRQFVSGQLGNVRQLIQVDVQRAKAELQKHVTEIRMMPQTEGKKGFYVAEGEWNLLGGYGDGAGSESTQHFPMVAGEGFEPSTFGL